MNSIEFVKKADKVAKQKKFSDESYDEIFQLFSSPSVTEIQKNNAKAYLKKDLALQAIISDILGVLSILFSIGIVSFGSIDSLVACAVLLLLVLLYVFILVPTIKSENYILSIIEDI